jgi:hypothetical protein
MWQSSLGRIPSEDKRKTVLLLKLLLIIIKIIINFIIIIIIIIIVFCLPESPPLLSDVRDLDLPDSPLCRVCPHRGKK